MLAGQREAVTHILPVNLVNSYILLYPLCMGLIIKIDDEPQKLLYIGFDRSLRVLEVITVIKVNGEEIVIHAMKATQKVIDILMEIHIGG